LKQRSGHNKGFFLFNLLTGTLGNALANLDNAPIELGRLKMKNVFDSGDNITSRLISRYKTDILKTVLKVIGSLDIVGNPVGLIENITTGAFDIVRKPVKGCMKGPIEGTKGIFLGIGSFVSKTISGTMNSISKITGTVAGVIATVNMVKKGKMVK